jgi:hypothetical protein
VTDLDLFNASPATVRELMQQTTDVETLRILADLESAISAGDVEEQVDAIDRLGDLLVLQRGIGL